MSNTLNYYQILNLAPTSSNQEIENAWDNTYNQVRRLVTHHDPKVANDANNGLRILEDVRATLLDPTRRAAYDEKIGIHQVSELGIQDEVITSSNTPTPLSSTPPRPNRISRSTTAEPLCPNCGSEENPSESRFCVKCQGSLTQICPNDACKAELRWYYPNCPKCGINIETKRREIKEELERQQRVLLNTINTHLESARQAVAKRFWRTAKQELSYFKGLGNPPAVQLPKTKQTLIVPICSKDDYPQQWNEAYGLNQSANVIKSQLTRSLVGLTALIYAGVGVLIGAFLGLSSAWGSVSRVPWYQAIFTVLISVVIFAIIGAAASAAAGAIGSFIYAYQWSGKQSNTTEHILGAVAPIGLAIGAGIALMLSGFIIIAGVAIIALMIWGGGG